MTWFQAIQTMLPRPERRSEPEIEDDLDSEFAFHLDQSARDLMRDEGLDHEAACGAARARFGTIDQIKKRCTRIVLEERIMLQRVNFVMMLVVTLLVIGVGIQVLLTQRYNTLALQAITADLARMKFETEATAASRISASSEKRGGFVYIDGKVSRPGVYSLPAGELTVKRLVAAAGGVVNCDNPRVIVTARSADGTNTVRYRAGHFKDLPADLYLTPDDHVMIEDGADQRGALESPQAGSRDRARADALYDFVRTLMTDVGVEHAGDHVRIRQVLDKMEAELPAKYPNDLDIQRLIKEMIQGRRKILEYDERGAAAAAAAPAAGATAQEQAAHQRMLDEGQRAKAEALENFLRLILVSADPGAPSLTARELIDQATLRINTDFADNHEMQVTLRHVIDEARKNLDHPAAGPATQPE